MDAAGWGSAAIVPPTAAAGKPRTAERGAADRRNIQKCRNLATVLVACVKNASVSPVSGPATGRIFALPSPLPYPRILELSIRNGANDGSRPRKVGCGVDAAGGRGHGRGGDAALRVRRDQRHFHQRPAVFDPRRGPDVAAGVGTERRARDRGDGFRLLGNERLSRQHRAGRRLRRRRSGRAVPHVQPLLEGRQFRPARVEPQLHRRRADASVHDRPEADRDAGRKGRRPPRAVDARPARPVRHPRCPRSRRWHWSRCWRRLPRPGRSRCDAPRAARPGRRPSPQRRRRPASGVAARRAAASVLPALFRLGRRPCAWAWTCPWPCPRAGVSSST